MVVWNGSGKKPVRDCLKMVGRELGIYMVVRLGNVCGGSGE